MSERDKKGTGRALARGEQMKTWQELVAEDFQCEHCGAIAGVQCASTSGQKKYQTHAARKSKLDHEKYTRGLLERCGWTIFGG